MLSLTFAGGQLRPLAVSMGASAKLVSSGLCYFGKKKNMFFFKPKWVRTQILPEILSSLLWDKEPSVVAWEGPSSGVCPLGSQRGSGAAKVC